ncbi:signal transduction histidine kinase [Dokdonella fugitiva]|uniref:histidine kinase n=2 Tax=Dokdonella fugitiva TaxID=328517 RepID=A0A839F467_9GAMM|nr:signal transduction histidine kinase [Dokdonella fugitiva]
MSTAIALHAPIEAASRAARSAPAADAARADAMEATLRALVDAVPTATLLFDADQQVRYANPAARVLARLCAPDKADRPLAVVGDWHPELLNSGALHLCSMHGSWSGEVILGVGRGQHKILLLHLSRVGADLFGMTVRDITQDSMRESELHARNAELEVAYAKLQGAQEQVMQSEKLASIGQLAAGVAHEINNPIGYVNSNLSTLQRYISQLFSAIQSYEAALAGGAGATEAESIRRKLDLDFLVGDVPQLLSESREGIDRVCKIVRDLKDFARKERSEDWIKADIHRGLDSTLNIIWNELKYKAQIVKTFGELPPVECLPSELNQVFMNVLMNAGQAIRDQGIITVTTSVAGERVRVDIGDDGEGIPPDVLPRVFDPFFTTKPVGSGTGLGLAISYGIVSKHHGTIEVSSTPGQGTLLRIELPIAQPR